MSEAGSNGTFSLTRLTWQTVVVILADALVDEDSPWFKYFFFYCYFALFKPVFSLSVKPNAFCNNSYFLSISLLDYSAYLEEVLQVDESCSSLAHFSESIYVLYLYSILIFSS